MKKLLSILLIFVFGYSILGFYLNFAIEQAGIKEEIREKIISKLPEAELVVIKIPTAEQEKIRWLEEGKEFIFGGDLYDVARIKKGSDTIFYFCLCDVKESRLLTNLDKLVKDQSDRSQSRSLQKKPQVNLFFTKALLLRCRNEAPVNYYTYPSFYYFHFCEVLFPPPRIPQTV
jgi:hypothetical protein